jgi:DNA polymerase-1
LIRPGILAPELACVSYSDGERAEVVHGDAAYTHLRWLLEQETVLANAPFDLAIAWSWYPELKDLIWDAVLSGRIHDVITGQKLIDIGEGNYRFIFTKINGKTTKLNYNLSHLHARYFGTFLEKNEWRLQYGKLRHLPLETWPLGARKYACDDAIATARIYAQQTRQQPRMRRHPSAYLHNEVAQTQAGWALHLMGARGVHTDDVQVQKVIAEIDVEQPKLKEVLFRGGLADRTGKRKDKRARALMYQCVGDAGELTDTGLEKVKKGELTKSEALKQGYIKLDEEWCHASQNDLLIAYETYSANQLLRSKLASFKTGSLPLHTQYDLLETGRASSAENKLVFNSAAIQNLPKKPGMRESLTAREDYALVASDFGLAELVSLAQITYSWFEKNRTPGDPWYVKCQMRETLNRGLDIHVDFAASMLGLSYEKAWELYKKGDKKLKEARQMAKAVNFGLPGGLSVESLVSYARKTYNVTLTPQRAKELHRGWMRKFPEMKLYFRLIRKMFNHRSSLDELLFDETDADQDKLKLTDIVQEVSRRIRGRCLYTQACNTFFQGLTADAAKAALVEISRRCYTDPSSDLYGSFPLLFIHDEIIVETPFEKLDAAAKELERVMVEVYQRFTPDVRITADAHAMFRWSKKAEAVYDDQGRLVPWQDAAFEEELAQFARSRGLFRRSMNENYRLLRAG